MQEGTLKKMQDYKGLPTSARMDEELVFTDHAWNYPEEDLLLGCT